MLSSIMIQASDFAKNFPNAVVPESLSRLLDFQNNTSGPEFYASGFELIVNEAPGMLETYSSDLAFLDALFIFAQASHSGSVYALWRKETNSDLNTVPIILFGDEGGVEVIAENIAGLLQLLTVDAEPFFSRDGIYMERQDNDPVSPASAPYKVWFKNNFNLDTITDVKPMIAAAQAKHQAAFKQWMNTFNGV
jgi:hypothetical protein